MARVFDFLHIANEECTRRGVDLPLEGQATTTAATRLERAAPCRSTSSGPMQSP